MAAAELDENAALGSWECSEQRARFLTVEFASDAAVVSTDLLVFWRWFDMCACILSGGSCGLWEWFVVAIDVISSGFCFFISGVVAWDALVAWDPCQVQFCRGVCYNECFSVSMDGENDVLSGLLMGAVGAGPDGCLVVEVDVDGGGCGWE